MIQIQDIKLSNCRVIEFMIQDHDHDVDVHDVDSVDVTVTVWTLGLLDSWTVGWIHMVMTTSVMIRYGND